MRHVLVRCLSALGLVLGCQPALAAGGVSISEYIEGSSYDKAVEIYNGTDAAVDLSAYELQFFFNGSVSPGRYLPLAGTLPAGDVYVVAHGAAGAAILAEADQTDSGSWFNGDDAVVLLNGGAAIDAIGQIGVDPGTEWGSGDASTADNTLRRKAGVCAGDNNAYDAFEPALEWDGFAINSVDGLGSHTCTSGSTGGGGGATSIHAIQGSGASGPMVGAVVTVQAVVVGDFQAAGQLGGFFIQEEDADADGDAATSEGLFVYHTATAVAVGDKVEVTGTVAEYYDLTELTTATVSVISRGHSLPSAASVSLPFAAADSLERYEGMRVVLGQQLTVTENYNLGRYGEAWLSSGGRLMQPTNVALPGADALAVQAANDLNRILVSDGLSTLNPDPIVFPDGELTAYNTLRSGDTVTGLAGVVDHAFGTYRVNVTAMPDFVAGNARSAAPATVGGTLKVASFNVLNYFNGDGQGGGFPTARGATTYEEFVRQREKIIAAITAMGADIIGLMEIENDGYASNSAIADLVNGLNAAAPAGTSYAFINPGVSVIGTDEIAVGIIYRQETVHPLGGAAILDASVDSRFDDTKNRPTLAQTFQEKAGIGRLTVAVNHLKSKGSVCTGDPDTGDGQGNCNLTRTAAAQVLVDWLATDPTQSGDADFLIIGDMNAYAKEEPIAAIKAGGYRDLIDHHLGAGSAYSYVFNGQSGYLDHALASSNLAAQVTGITEWHINCDEPFVLDYNVESKSANQVTSLYNADPFRASDHDPVIVGLSLSGSGSAASVHVGDLDGSATGTSNWKAYVTVLVSDDAGSPVAGATVSGEWSGGVTGTAACTTSSDGRCTLSVSVSRKKSSVAFTVTDVAHASLSYASVSNSDPDGDSNGTSITVSKP